MRARTSRNPAFAMALAWLCSCAHPQAPTPPIPRASRDTPAPGELRGPEAYAAIGDRDVRARALFMEASRVMLHPRCINCHPEGDTPMQGNASLPHDPPVVRGPEDRGVVALECTSCHQEANAALARVPGAPGWRLAPRAMAWAKRSPRALCELMKDPARNGGRSLGMIVQHVSHDPLVGWGWSPGAGREPVPGTQDRFGALIGAWVEAGAACPDDGGTSAPQEARR
jgi:hypothetical protein